MPLGTLVILIVIAALCGAAARLLAGGTGGGFVTSAALGFIGTLIGPWLAHQFGFGEPFPLTVGGETFPIVWSILGAAGFLALIHLLSGPKRTW